MKKINVIIACLFALLLVLVIVMPVSAIGNPTTIRFYGNISGGQPRVKAFYNVKETGDMLFLAETYVHYASIPTDYTAKQAFSFELLNASDKTTVLQSTPIIDYECKIASIYQTAAQVTALSLVNNTQYWLRIVGNPTIFGTPTENVNEVFYRLDISDWADQEKGNVSDASNTLLLYVARGSPSLASDLQTNDGVTTYITTSQGYNYLTSIGGNIFLQGCPNLNIFVPKAFQTSASVMSATDPSSANGLADPTKGNITMTNQLGARTASGFTNLGFFLGGSSMPQWEAGLLGLFIIMFVIAIAVAKATGHPQVGIIIGSMTLMVGGFLGLMPMGLAFAITILIVVLTVWFFFSRGYV